jgi:hypothetical protein
MTPTATNPVETPTPTPTPASAAINVTGYSAYVVSISETQYDINVGVVLDGAVNVATVLIATVNTNAGTVNISVIIPDGDSSGIGGMSYIEDPSPVGPNCLSFSSGDTRVSLTGFTCP